MHSDEYASRRHRLIDHLRNEGISNEAVLAALGDTPRHLFVDESSRASAYENRPLPIGEEQTISQPYIVALMTELLLGGTAHLGKVLEIGTGCGYQTAILARLAEQVYTVERIASLQVRARATLAELGWSNIEFRVGDGYGGWSEHQPFDGIIVTAAPAEVPQCLLDQLAIGGRLVVPVGGRCQVLRTIIRSHEGFDQEDGCAVRFVPMLPGPPQ
jgi:protein-L-isoaspartate(D-aspartate) O-methyltransferase